MKCYIRNICLPCFIFILFYTSVSAQWTQQESYDVSPLYSISFTDATTGYTVGGRWVGCGLYVGTIHKTTNGGANWVEQVVPYSMPFSYAYFINSDTGYAVYCDGNVVKTTNGGSEWVLKTRPNIDSAYSINFTSENNGYMVGKNLAGSGVIAKTTDGGSHWTSQLVNKPLFSVSFPDANTGYAAGANGEYYKTTDAGNSWAAKTTAMTNDLRSVFFRENNTGFMVGQNGIILMTTNGGNNWLSKNISTYENLYSVYFVNANTGYAAGSFGPIVKTTDGGNNWFEQSSGISKRLFSVFFTDEKNGWVSGEDGVILHTYNGGNGLFEMSESMGLINVYPNPNNGVFKINSDKQGKYQLSIYNTLGQLVYAENINNLNNRSVVLPDPENGIYTAILKNEKGTWPFKLLIKK
jgi:photosystem II stability/assembly factor-like uncharacterized protein